MKKNILRVLACALVLLTIPAVLCVFAFALPTQYDHTFLGELKYKTDALKETPSKRIIIAGGSGAAFGVDSALMESLLPGYSVVNFGMYAGLGSTVMLDLAQPMLHKGDIVVFMPEQSEQTLSMYFNAESMWQAADGRFSLLSSLRKEDLSAMIGHFPSFAADKFNLWRSRETLMPDGVYSRAAFNEYGDVANVPREGNIMPGGADASMPIRFEEEMISSEFAAYVRAYAQGCAEGGVRFVYRFCPMNERALSEGAAEDADEYCAYLQNVLGCDVIGDIASSVMAAGWFYDTNFHLNDAGVTVNTVRMAQELAQYLGIEIDVAIDLPQMPDILSAEVLEGDNSDEAFFEYEVVGNDVRITGLTDEGKRQEKLTVPTAHRGMAVTSFAAETFAGNGVLRELRVQANIAHIDDGSFEGCTALEKIILGQDKPHSCTVGQDLLRGTDAVIHVPQHSLAAYASNYFWAPYAARLRADGEAQQTAEPQESEEPSSDETQEEHITYHGNGGVRRDGSEAMTLPRSYAHLRVNTAQGTRYFSREGYVLTGWNTEQDGSGEAVSLGSRIEYREGLTLYAQWAQAEAKENFTWTVQKNEVHITAYHGGGDVCVVPERIDGMKVTRICRDAFKNVQVDKVILPVTMFCIEREAFSGCTLRELVLYDTLYYVYDESFLDCPNLTTLRINAATSPAYSATYFDTFSDKYDWLLSIRDEQKIVLFSGSSGRFGYDSEAIMAALPPYQAANMGVYAYTNALPQLDLICDLMREGDILLSAPEFDTLNNQFCITNALDAHFFAMMESNYDALSLLDIREYSNVFEALRQYLTARSPITSGSYDLSAKGFDDDGNAYPFDTYNIYGDLTLPRKGSSEDVLLQRGLADYTKEAFSLETIECLNAAYQPFLKKGVRVYFSYTPRNWSSLTEGSTPQARAELHAHLKAHLCVPLISEIEEYLYPGTYFYLIDSHLSSEGVILRTQSIIGDIKAQLEREETGGDI